MRPSLRPFEAHALLCRMVCCSAGRAGLHADFKDSPRSSQERYCKAALKNAFDLRQDYRMDAMF